MTVETADVVERMFRVLVDEIRGRRPELLESTFTVAEIYQDLVPYRTHRDRIGVEMNGDYEHALLRLLAGDGNFLSVESDAARRELRKELESVNPDTGIYREFAAVEVRLDPERLEELPTPGAEEPDDPPDLPDPEPVESARGDDAPAPEAPLTEGPPGHGEAAAEAEVVEDCRWCREPLPDRGDLRFCPFCGARVDLVPCPDCGAELEEEWRFCVACGTEVARG